MSEAIRLFLTGDADPARWRHTLALARGLADHDVETTLAVIGPDPNGEQREAAHAVPSLKFLETGLPIADTPEAVEEVGAAMARFANVVDPDIVHLHDPALAASGRFHAPVVVTCDTCAATRWKAIHATPMPADVVWRPDVVRRGYRAAAVLIAPSAAFADMTARTYGLSASPRVVPHGAALDPDRDRPPSTTDFALAAGPLWDEAGNLAALNRAAALLPIPVMAAGSRHGPAGESLDLGHLWALGDLDYDDLARWLRSAPVFVSTARYEPSGLSVLGAARLGCALVLSDIASFREMWAGAAEFVPPDDEDAIAAAIAGIVHDPAARDRLGEAARERSLIYTPQATAAGMAEVYRSVLSRDEMAPHLEAAE